MRQFDLVIFDCDGVLVDSEVITNRLMRDNLAGYGLDLPLEEIVRLFVGGTMQGVMETALRMGADLPADWLDEIYREMFAALAEQVEAVDGVPAMLDVLDAAGLPYAVGSNGPHAKMNVTLERTGLMPRFAGRIVSREDVARPKPAPDVYLRAAQIVGVPPQRCVVVEDSGSGAKAGKAAGMTVFGYVPHGTSDVMRASCDRLFDDMRELPELLDLA